MIKLVVFLVLFFLAYVLTSLFGGFDYNIFISFKQYEINVELLFLIFCFLLFCFFFAYLFKIISFIINSPKQMRSFFLQKTLSKNNDALSIIFCKYLLELELEVEKNILEFNYDIRDFQKILESSSNKELLNITSYFQEKDIELKIKYLMKLQNNQNLKIFVQRKLAALTFNVKNFVDSEIYIKKVTEGNDANHKDFFLLLSIYYERASREEFIITLSEIFNFLDRISAKDKLKISNFCFEFAKLYLQEQNITKAQDLLNKALLLNQGSYEIVEALYSIYLKDGKYKDIDTLIINSFKHRPSFHVALLYLKYTKKNTEEIYNFFSGLVDVKKNLSVFISIAAFLNLTSKVSELSELLE